MSKVCPVYGKVCSDIGCLKKCAFNGIADFDDLDTLSPSIGERQTIDYEIPPQTPYFDT